MTRLTRRRSTTIPLVAAVLALSALPFCAEGGAPAQEPIMGGVVLRTLPNGLRVIVREQHGAPLVAIDLWVRAGSGFEGPKESGAAHFLEHLLFKGTPTRKPGEIDAAIEDLGATLRAGTTRDAAHFWTTVAAPYYTSALGVVSDAVMHPLLAPEEVERERAVILDELARGRNDWRKQVLDGLYARLYPDRPYGRPVLGWVDSLETLSRDVIYGFYRRYYAPNNATLVLVGDLTPDSASAAAMAAFGGWAKRDVILPVEAPTPTAAPAASEQPADAAVAAAALGYRAPDCRDRDLACSADVLARILGDPRAGRLQSDLKGVCAPEDVHADFELLREPSMLAIYAAAAPKRLDQARALLEAEVRRLKAEGVAQDEIAYARRRLLASFLYDVETYSGQARLLGEYDMMGDYTLATRYPADLARVTPATVSALIERYLVPQNRAELTIRPGGAR